MIGFTTLRKAIVAHIIVELLFDHGRKHALSTEMPLKLSGNSQLQTKPVANH
jgi:hypothetical protein